MKMKKGMRGLLTAALTTALGITTALALPALPARAATLTFTDPNNGHSYEWKTREDGALVLYKDGVQDANEFVSDGSYTYYCVSDGTVMKDRLTYHPDGQHVIYFDAEGHEVFNNFTHISVSISGDAVDDLCYFGMTGYMYTNTVTYDATGTKLYYINPYGRMENTGLFYFDANASYGGGDTKWTFTGDSYMGFANADGTLLVNQASYDPYGNAIYFQGNGEYKVTVANQIPAQPNISVSNFKSCNYTAANGNHTTWSIQVANTGAAGSADLYYVLYDQNGSMLWNGTHSLHSIAAGTCLLVGDDIDLDSKTTSISRMEISVINVKPYSGDREPQSPAAYMHITLVNEHEAQYNPAKYTYDYRLINTSGNHESGFAVIVLYKGGEIVAADMVGSLAGDFEIDGGAFLDVSSSSTIFNVDHDSWTVCWLPF